jgi:hypothetical protein
MGSPLGPLFANIFMDEFENNHMAKLNELGLKTWNRYVDDVFSLIENKDSAKTVLNFLNSQHNNIRFTIEWEKNNKLPFLDTLVTRKEEGFSTNIYHKPTFTGVYLNWTSLTSRKYKISLIYCLCDRIWKISKNPDERDNEIKKLKHTLIKNEYPEVVINKEIEKFINNRMNINNTSTTDTSNNNTLNLSNTESTNSYLSDNTLEREQIQQLMQPEKQKKFIVLPYCNYKAENFATRLTKLVNDNFEQIDFKVAFKAPNEIWKEVSF